MLGEIQKVKIDIIILLKKKLLKKKKFQISLVVKSLKNKFGFYLSQKLQKILT